MMIDSCSHFPIVFEERGNNELARLLLQQAAAQYGVVMGYSRNENRAVRTENCEPLASSVRSYAIEFLKAHCSDPEWATDGFAVSVTMRPDMRSTDIDWSGRKQLSKYIRLSTEPTETP